MSLATTQALPAGTIGQLVGHVRNAHARATVAAGLFMSSPAFAIGGGKVDSVQTRVEGVVSGFQGIMQGVGVAVLSAAVLYVGYGMAFGGKKWSDVANVAYGATIAGMGSIMVGWLFS